jgi:hypothetical protein
MQTRRKNIGTSKSANFSLFSMIEPQNFAQASQDDHWIKAMNEELDKIEKNETWDLVPRSCWVCVKFFSCVCVGASDSTTVSDDPNCPRSLCHVRWALSWGGPRGGGGGAGLAPLVMCSVRIWVISRS